MLGLLGLPWVYHHLAQLLISARFPSAESEVVRVGQWNKIKVRIECSVHIFICFAKEITISLCARERGGRTDWNFVLPHHPPPHLRRLPRSHRPVLAPRRLPEFQADILAWFQSILTRFPKSIDSTMSEYLKLVRSKEWPQCDGPPLLFISSVILEIHHERDAERVIIEQRLSSFRAVVVQPDVGCLERFCIRHLAKFA